MPHKIESMWTLHPFCIHILRWSLKRSVKRTWTRPPFPPLRVLDVQWSRAPSLVCEVALTCPFACLTILSTVPFLNTDSLEDLPTRSANHQKKLIFITRLVHNMSYSTITQVLSSHITFGSSIVQNPI
jgi:hypothetical protein